VRRLITAVIFPFLLPLSFVLLSPVAIIASLATGSGAPSYRVARFWVSLVLPCLGIRVKVKYLHPVPTDRPVVFASNHASQMDILALYKALPVEFRFIVKKELFNIPLLGLAMRTAGYISIDRSGGRAAVSSIKMAARQLKEGASIVIFPEGTRSPDGRLRDFKEGGFMLAIKSGCPVVPVAIRGSSKVLKKGSLIAHPGTIEVILGKPIGGLDNREKKLSRKEITRLAHEQVAQMLRQ